MKNNNKWFSIVIALWLVLLINLIVINILEYIIPFSKDTKDIENSVVSYYQADTGIENALFYLKQNDYIPWTFSSTTFTTNPISSLYNIDANWVILPKPWEWNSEYDSNWDQLAIWNPIQLEIWGDRVDFNNDEFAFRIPNLKDWTNLTLSWTSLAIINWQISSENNTLNATGSYIIADDICMSGISCDNPGDFIDFNKSWIDLNNSLITSYDFYNENCSWVWSWCILKLSIINKLETDNILNPILVPYLEWRFKFNKDIPLRYSIINTSWKAYWYKNDLKIRIPQQTTNEAFDFTVFQ